MDVTTFIRTTSIGAMALGVGCGDAQAGIVINEIMNNPVQVSDTRGEWFELYNTGVNDVDLVDWTFLDSGSNRHVVDRSVTVPAGGFLLLARAENRAINGGIEPNYVYGSDLSLGNGADELILVSGAGVEVDRVEWDGGGSFPDPSGASMALIDPRLDNNQGANWLVTGATSVFGDGDRGTPGTENFPRTTSLTVPEPPPLSLIGAALLGLGRVLRRPAAKRKWPAAQV